MINDLVNILTLVQLDAFSLHFAVVVVLLLLLLIPLLRLLVLLVVLDRRRLGLFDLLEGS